MNSELLKEICEVNGAPGFEEPIRQVVLREIKELVDEIKIDNLGNVIALKKGVKHGQEDNKKVLSAAHMDEIGFIVKYIDDKGFVRFHTLGGFDPKTLTAQRVIIHGKKDVIGVMGSKPIHVMEPEEKNKPVKISDYFIDLGMKKEDVDKYVTIGDPITRERELIKMGDCFNCKSLDNRVSVFVLIEALKKLKGKEIPYDFYAAFTVQEEVGLRGANVTAQQVNPDLSIALDTTIAYDLPNAQPHEYVTRLGEGAAIKIMDASAICDVRMVRYLKEIANHNGIKWQPEILTAGGTDTAGLQQRGKNGSIAGAISIPTRHLHQVIEMSHQEDIQGAIDLLTASIESMEMFNNAYA